MLDQLVTMALTMNYKGYSVKWLNYCRNAKEMLALNNPVSTVELNKLIKRVEKRDVVNVNSKKNIKDVSNSNRQLTKLVNCPLPKNKMDTNKNKRCSHKMNRNLAREENSLHPVLRHIKNFANEEWRSSKMKLQLMMSKKRKDLHNSRKVLISSRTRAKTSNNSKISRCSNPTMMTKMMCLSNVMS